jgi:hypothetical protein
VQDGEVGDDRAERVVCEVRAVALDELDLRTHR